ncbi:MAG TPA: hypothetical protein VFR78_21225 [Pyrinomonadaceae bacterium]|nr:hypothetical protein [Pyrinomonadaceae bacterium]
MPYRCSIYGLGVISNKAIPGVPVSPITAADVRISFGSLPEWVREDTQLETSYVADYNDDCGNPMLRVFRVRDGAYYRFSYADRTEFVLDHGATEIWADWPEPLTLEDAATYLLGPIMGFVMLLRGVVCLHASAIAIGDEAIAVLGPAGSGKSTTAAAFSERGYRVLAEDVVTLDDHGRKFLVRPAYPCIRLWPSSVKALYGSETHLPKLTPNWEKRYLDLTERPEQFQSRPLPLAAVYQLGERSNSAAAPFVEPVDRAEGLISLVANTYATKLMDKQMRAREFEVLTRVLRHVAVRRVTPHTDPARIYELCDSILNDYGHGFSRIDADRNTNHAAHV